MTDELKQWEYDKGYTKGYSDGRASLIEELEQLRAELHETAEMHSNRKYYLHDEWIDEYIDKHISELKGENEE